MNASEHVNVFIRDLATGTETQLTECGGYCGVPKWAPDGNRIGYLYQYVGTGLQTPGEDGGTRLTFNTQSEFSPSWGKSR